jgi:hypothetical protein
MKLVEPFLTSRTTSDKAIDGPETKQHMHVVRHAMDSQELLVPLAHDAGHVLVKLFLVLLLNQIGTALHGKDHLEVNL